MKKIVTTVMIMICSLFMTGLMNNSVNAGQLDKNESYVLEKISEDKFSAKVQQRYINQLKNYFCQDDISLGKGEAEDFVKYLGEALSEKNGDTPKEMADSYIRFEKAGSAIGLLLSYDSRENVFYFTDSSGYIVLDFQDVVKNTGNEKSGMPTELIFTAIIGLCIIGLLLNLGRWGRKISRNSDTDEDDEDENELEVANRRTRRARMQTFSYKAVKQILRYCFVPIIMGLIVIGAVMVGMTFFDDITSSVKNNFINTQPVYVESNRQFVKTTVKKDKQKKTIKLSDISTPKYGDQYGEITCDKLQLKAPVYFGDRGNILKKGAGQYNGSFLPELIRSGNKYGVKIKATAPSIHFVKANILTEISPIIGSEEQAKDLIDFINNKESEDNIWETNIFGKSIGQIVDEGIMTKINNLTEETQSRMQGTIEKITNDQSRGVICIVL